MFKSEWKVVELSMGGRDYYKVYRNIDRFMADVPKNREMKQGQFFSKSLAQEEADRLNRENENESD